MRDLHCDPKVKGMTERSLLHSACEGGNIDLVRTLIEEFHADVNDISELHYTPLHTAALHGKLEVVLLLIKEYRCDPNIKGIHRKDFVSFSMR